MSTYRFAAVCKGGHCIDAWLHSPETEERYCPSCGAEVITRCLGCQTPIRGKYDNPSVLDLTPFHVPQYCSACGKPYPWTEAAIEAAATMLEEESELDEIQKKNLISSLPDIVSETPKTKLAVVRLKKALLSVGAFTAEGLRQFAIDFGCELAKQQMGM